MIKKFFKYTVVFLFLSFIAFGILLQTPCLRNSAKNYLIATVQERTGYRLEIADIRLFPSFQFSASEISVFDGDRKLLQIKQLHFEIVPFELFKKHIHLSAIRANGVTLYMQDQKKTGDQSIKESLIVLPFQCSIDQFIFSDVTIVNDKGKDSFTVNKLQGLLYWDPKKPSLFAKANLNLNQNPDELYHFNLQYTGHEGNIQINDDEKLHLRTSFALQEDAITFKDFNARYDLCKLTGTATLTYQGKFLDSSLSFSVLDTSGNLPFKGELHGNGQLRGFLHSPELSLSLYSKQLESNGIILNDVEAKISSKPVTEVATVSNGGLFSFPEVSLSIYSKRLEFNGIILNNLETKFVSNSVDQKMVGAVSMAFLQEKIPYQFSAKVYWNDSLFPDRLQTKIDLETIAQFVNAGSMPASGDVDLTVNLLQKTFGAKINDGKVENVNFGSVISNIEAEIKGDMHHLELIKLTAKDNKQGTYQAKGSLTFDKENHFPFQFAFQFKDAHPVQLPLATMTTNGDLLLEGNVLQSTLKGSVSVDSLTLQIPEKPPTLTPSVEVTYINQDPRQALPTSIKKEKMESIPINFSVRVSFPNNIKVQGKDLKSEWKGEMAVSGSASSPQVKGELTLIKGNYKVKGRKLNIKEGKLTFPGDIKKISIDLIGEMEIDRYTIEIIVKGPVKNPSISLRSNPPLSRKEILSWVLFNKDISGLSEFQGNKLNESLITLSAVTEDNGPDLLTSFGNAIGFDRLDVSSPDAKQVSVELGKYVSDNTYIFISRKPRSKAKRVGTGTLDPNAYDQTNRIGIETSLDKSFKLQAEVDEDQFGQINLIWKKDY